MRLRTSLALAILAFVALFVPAYAHHFSYFSSLYSVTDTGGTYFGTQQEVRWHWQNASQIDLHDTWLYLNIYDVNDQINCTRSEVGYRISGTLIEGRYQLFSPAYTYSTTPVWVAQGYESGFADVFNKLGSAAFSYYRATGWGWPNCTDGGAFSTLAGVDVYWDTSNNVYAFPYDP